MNKYLAYLCVTLIMGVVGFVSFGLLGFLMDASLSLVGGKPLVYANTFALATIGMMMFALSVYVENPIVTIFKKLYPEKD